MIDHIGVQVADVEASLAFYLGVFAPIGMREAMRFPHGDSIFVGLCGPDGQPTFWLNRGASAETRELHLAFRAPDRTAAASPPGRAPLPSPARSPRPPARPARPRPTARAPGPPGTRPALRRRVRGCAALPGPRWPWSRSRPRPAPAPGTGHRSRTRTGPHRRPSGCTPRWLRPRTGPARTPRPPGSRRNARRPRTLTGAG